MTNRDPARTRIKPQLLSGFRDQLPAQMLLRRTIMERFRTVFERHGFEPIETPVLEHLEILTGKAGENEKLMYQFVDHGGRQVGMRYDLTVPLARFVAQHESELALPFKRYHMAPVWRAEKAQRGRLREFYQCDADIVGAPGVVSDAEAIAMVAELLDTVNLTSAKVRVSHRQLLAGLARAAGVPEEAAASVYRSIDKLDKIGREGVQREIIGMSVEPIAADRLLSSVTISGESHAVLAELGRLLPVDPPQEVRAALVELAELFDLLSKLSSRPEMFVLDPSLARGLDYYTGIVYEAVVEEPKVGSVSGGGRYDGLVGMFSGRPLAANGISMGLERIVEVVNEFGLLEAPVTVCDAIVTYEAETLPHAAQVARIAREAGWNVDLSVATRKGLGEQLKYASRRGIPRALIVGRTEADAGTVSLRDLQTGEQETLPVEALADRVRAMTRDRR